MEKQITINGVSFSYSVRRTTKSKIYIRVRNGKVVISATKKTTIEEIESLLHKHIFFIVKNLEKAKKEDIIHVNGIGYKPKFLIGEKECVMINGDEIYITTKTLDYSSQKKALYNFYKTLVEKELVKIMLDATNDFKEIKFPTISVRYMKSMFGNYYKNKHHVKLSSILAKYDFKYIKHVLYHELCHVSEFNHSKAFFILFEKKYKDARNVRKTFKKIKYNDYL